MTKIQVMLQLKNILMNFNSPINKSISKCTTEFLKGYYFFIRLYFSLVKNFKINFNNKNDKILYFNFKIFFQKFFIEN